jgi:signal transduction histidine kinase
VKSVVNLDRIEGVNLTGICTHCTTINIFFKSTEESAFYFELHDNGIGFDVNNSFKNGHYGIQNMEARAKECNANFYIKSAPNEGTTLILTYNR